MLKVSVMLSYFNSHAHVERDVQSPAVAVDVVDFNSHAHVERDRAGLKGKNMKNISTHTLTWSVTLTINNIAQRGDISTHTLTWSVTFTNCLPL